MRTELTQDTTFYVAPAGSDSADGLTLATAWKTLQHAWDTLLSQYDLAGFRVTVQIGVGNGFYGVNCSGALLGSRGPSSLIFNGTPGQGNTLIQPQIGCCFAASNGAAFTLQNVALDTTI